MNRHVNIFGIVQSTFYMFSTYLVFSIYFGGKQKKILKPWFGGARCCDMAWAQGEKHRNVKFTIGQDLGVNDLENVKGRRS